MDGQTDRSTGQQTDSYIPPTHSIRGLNQIYNDINTLLQDPDFNDHSKATSEKM